MLAKYWKRIGLFILIGACLFNVVTKLVKKMPIKEQLIQTAQYVVNMKK